MAKWLDKYEQGGMVLKQKTHDNYGKKPNPNDVQASVGPDFVGLGYNTKGRDYSPAWGGQFQMGGILPGATGFMYARTQDPAPSNGPYAKKTKASAQEGKKMPKAYWSSNDDREAYRKNLKAAAEAALNNNASDEDLLISTSYHDMNTGNNCINGVCGLNRKAGLTYNAPTDNDRFLSGEKFAQAVAKGDEDYYQVSGNFQPGDHLQYRHKEGSSSHNKIIYDVQADDKGQKIYKVVDNAGGKDMRSRDYTEAELKELVEKGGGGYDKVNIYRPGYNLDKPLLDKEREAKTSPEARAALAERKNIQEWDASHNPGFDYSIRPESEYYNKQPEGMKKFIDFANDDAKVTALAKKLNVGKDIIHDQLLNTFGELGQENKWEDPWFGGDLSKGISPIPIPFESTMEKVLNAVGGGKGWSVGPGQIKFNTLDPELRKQFGINKPKDLHDFDKVIPLMTAINVKNKKWMENQGDDLSTKLVGNPGTSADEIKYGVDRWVPYAYQGLPNDPIAVVRKRAEANANEYRMSKKDREDYISNYINKNVDPEKLKTFDEGSYANSVYNLIDKNLSRTMPAQNYEQYNELMPVTVKSKKKMQKGGVIKDDRGQWAYPGEITEIGSNDITMQGVNYPVLGVSDTGDTQMMQPNQDYKFDGEKVTEFPMAQDGKKLKNAKGESEKFLKGWMDSPIYKKMINTSINASPNQQEEILKAISREDQLKKMSWEFADLNADKSWLDKLSSPILGQFVQDKNKVLLNPSSNNDTLSEVGVHEGSHATDLGGINIPRSDIEKMSKYKKEYEKQKGFFTKLLDDKDFNTYVGRPTETRGRLNAIRYLGKKEGIYDPYKEKVDKDILKKLPSSIFHPTELDQLRKIYNDDQIIDLLNSVSKNDSNKLIPQAQNGIELIPYIASAIPTIMGGAKSLANKAISYIANTDLGKEKLQNFARNVDPYDYSTFTEPSSLERIYKAGIKNIKEPYREELDNKFKEGFASTQDSVRMDLLNRYAGLPEKYGTLKKSNYTPTKGNKNESYSSSPQIERMIKEELPKIKTKKELEKWVSNTATYEESKKEKDHYVPIKGKGSNYVATIPALGQGTYGIGEDKEGFYLSYYDKWDLNPFSGKNAEPKIIKNSGGVEDKSKLNKIGRWMLGEENSSTATRSIGNPANIYGRIYFDKKTGKPKMQNGGWLNKYK